MSSIFGKCNLNNKPVDNNEVVAAIRALNHWNADETGVAIDGHVALGNLLLWNTPESKYEKMPFSNPNTGNIITADARIDNRDEILQKLGRNNPEGRKLPDSQLILLLYNAYGANCINHLIGDFAFAIWDPREGRLFCARDHMGVKPFFYYNDTSFFAFASEKKGLLCLPGLDKTIDLPFLYNQAFQPVVQGAETTLYKNIRRLEPAHTLVFYPRDRKLNLQQYWTLDADTELTLPDKNDYYEGLRHHLETAVKCRLSSAYPVGAELSGGLDSSAITGIASALLRKDGNNIITFSNVEDPADKEKADIPGQSEREFAEAVIKFNGITDYQYVIKDIWKDTLEEVDHSLNQNDGLEMWTLPWQMPIKKAAQHRQVRTLLSGFPGDEMVTYRGQFFFLDYLDNGEYLRYFRSHSEREFNKWKPFIPPRLEFWMHKLKNLLSVNDDACKFANDLINVPVKYWLMRNDMVWKDPTYLERFKSHRHYQKYRLLKPKCPLRMEAESRFGLYYRLESRFPMADIRLTQFYLSMPNSIKSEGAISRSAYRTAVKQYLPEKVLLRDNKLGNMAPFRTTPTAVKARQNTLYELLNIKEGMAESKKIVLSQHPNYKYTQMQFLELLRWFSGGFENL